MERQQFQRRARDLARPKPQASPHGINHAEVRLVADRRRILYSLAECCFCSARLCRLASVASLCSSRFWNEQGQHEVAQNSQEQVANSCQDCSKHNAHGVLLCRYASQVLHKRRTCIVKRSRTVAADVTNMSQARRRHVARMQHRRCDVVANMLQ